MLEFQNVTFQYAEDDYQMMKDLSFQVEEGAFVSIIGASGCGKSTIFRLINGLEQPQSGQIFYDGKPISSLSHFSAYMPQKDLLFPWRTVGQNLALPLEIGRVPKAEQQQKVRAMLKEVGLSDYENRYPKELSGGMRQRAAFARTLLTGSRLLLLDEPFSALDSLTKIALQQWLLQEWEKYRQTVLFVTHDVEEAIFLSDRVLVVYDRPITHLEAYPIPLPHPRNREDLKRPDMQELKEKLIKELGGGSL